MRENDGHPVAGPTAFFEAVLSESAYASWLASELKGRVFLQAASVPLSLIGLWGNLGLIMLPEPSATGSGSILSFGHQPASSPGPMKPAMMHAANRDGELVAASLSKCPQLCQREVMRIRRYSPAH